MASTVDYPSLAADVAKATLTNGGAPSLTDLAEAWGLSGPAGALKRVKQLVRHGYMAASKRQGEELTRYHPTPRAFGALAQRGDLPKGSRPIPPVVVIYNEAGGMGKSTLARALAEGMAKAGFRVLAVDADPQSTLTSWLLGGEESALEETLFHLYKHRRLPEPRQVSEHLYLIPAVPEMHQVNELIGQVPGTTMYLARALKKDGLLERYDLVVFDTKGTRDALVESALMSANLALVPFQPSPKGVMGGLAAVEAMMGYGEFHDLDDFVLGAVPNMLDTRVKADRKGLDYMQGLLEEWGVPIFSPIPYRPAAFRGAEMRDSLGADNQPLWYTMGEVVAEILRRRTVRGAA